MGEKLRDALLEAKKKENKSQPKGKMLNGLHDLDTKIESFINSLEDKINAVEDNPTFVKKAHQLLANMSKEYSEFIMALRAIVNAVDRKSQIIPVFDKIESQARDVRNGIENAGGKSQEEMENESINHKNSIKKALES